MRFFFRSLMLQHQPSERRLTRAGEVQPENQNAGKPVVFAQVGEWLKPTDCKSVPPSEVRRFESFPVHQISSDSVNRLAMALAAYVGLGVLTWATIDDQRIRLITVAILAMFAMKTWVRRRDTLHPGGGSEDEPM